MALKATLEQWNAAVEAFDCQDYNACLDLFEPIADNSRIHYNIGAVMCAVGDYESAVRALISALFLDKYFAVAYFQKGVANVRLGEWEAAFEDFNDALLYMRGNLLIDYTQLGLMYKLYSCEILHNRGLCYMRLGEHDLGMKDLDIARRELQLPEHEIIERAYRGAWAEVDIFEVPTGTLFRPNSEKLKNVKKVDYLGKSKLISSADDKDTHLGFKGVQDRKLMAIQVTSPLANRAAGASPNLYRSASTTAAEHHSHAAQAGLRRQVSAAAAYRANTLLTELGPTKSTGPLEQWQLPPLPSVVRANAIIPPLQSSPLNPFNGPTNPAGNGQYRNIGYVPATSQSAPVSQRKYSNQSQMEPAAMVQRKMSASRGPSPVPPLSRSAGKNENLLESARFAPVRPVSPAPALPFRPGIDMSATSAAALPVYREGYASPQLADVRARSGSHPVLGRINVPPPPPDSPPPILRKHSAMAAMMTPPSTGMQGMAGPVRASPLRSQTFNGASPGMFAPHVPPVNRQLSRSPNSSFQMASAARPPPRRSSPLGAFPAAPSVAAYGSGADIGYAQPDALPASMVGVRVLLHYGDTCVLLVDPRISFDNFRRRAEDKVGAAPGSLIFKFVDGQQLVRICGDEDFAVAKEVFCSPDGQLECMEIYCYDP